MNDEVVERYEKIADIYDDDRFGNPSGDFRSRKEVNYILKLVRKYRARDVLEVGCGTGRFLIPLKKAGVNACGIDPSQNMIDNCQKKAKDNNVTLNLRKTNIFHDNKKEEYDFVFAIHVIMHLSLPETAVEKMKDKAKVGGVAVFDVYNRKSICSIISHIFNPRKDRGRLFTRKQLFDKFPEADIKGLFLFPKFAYGIPLINEVLWFLESTIPIPVSWKNQYFVVIRK